MFGLESLDVVIGLFFVYLLLSLICVALNEIIAHFLHLRGKMLKDAVYQLLLKSDTKPTRAEVARHYGNELLNKEHTSPENELAARVYAHPLITSLKERLALRVLNFFRRKGLTPSYIPSRTFVKVLLDVVRRDGIGESKTLPPLSQVALNGAELEKKFGNVGQVLRLLAEHADGNKEKFEESVEEWFDDAMDRLGAAYKRRIQLVGMIVAIAVAVSVNANTISIVRTLSTNSTLRLALVGMAVKAVGDSTNRGTPGVAVPSVAVVQPAAGADSAGRTAKPDSAVIRLRKLTDALDSLGVLGLPIGYPPLKTNVEALRDTSTWRFARAMMTERIPLVKKGWLGLLITAFAISLGAPFWFDLLNKVVSLRSSGAKPEESEEERKQQKK
ncbi:MAG: hypothetical protein ABI877_01665 [Gemmatimonadaceae bacterium]